MSRADHELFDQYHIVAFLGEDIRAYLTMAGVRLLQLSPRSEVYLSHVKWGYWTVLAMDGIGSVGDLKARIGEWLDTLIQQRSAA